MSLVRIDAVNQVPPPGGKEVSKLIGVATQYPAPASK